MIKNQKIILLVFKIFDTNHFVYRLQNRGNITPKKWKDINFPNFTKCPFGTV